jgi:hypothetical protein
VPNRLDVSIVLQHIPDAWSGLRGAAVHASASLLPHATGSLRRHHHLLVPSGERLPGRRFVQPHQQWRGPVRLRLTISMLLLAVCFADDN